MKFYKFLAALALLLPFAQIAKADLCIDASTGKYVTCSASATGPLGAPGPIGGGTPSTGAFTTLSVTGAITSTLATGTAPFTVASTTNVANLNAALLNGTTFAAPAAIGSGTPAAGAFTTLSASGAVSGAGFSTYLASPPAIGGSAAAAGNFTTLGASGLLTGTLGATITGAATAINTNSNFNTTIGTGTTTGTVAIGNTAGTGSALTIAAPITIGLGTSLSQASWASTGIGFNASAATFNDTTTGSGGVSSDSIFTIGAMTVTNTQGTSNVLTSLNALRIGLPVCGSGWASCSNLNSLTADGKIVGSLGMSIVGAAVNLNASSNFGVNIGTGTTTQTVAIGNGANLVNLGPTEITVGTVFTLGNFSGCSGTNGTPTTLSGGPQSGSFVTASSGTTCSVVVTINGATGKTAAHGWACFATDITTAVNMAQSATSTTTCTLKGTINAVGDTVVFQAMGY